MGVLICRHCIVDGGLLPTYHKLLAAAAAAALLAAVPGRARRLFRPCPPSRGRCARLLHRRQKLWAFPALLLAVAMLASGGSSLVHQSVLSGCAGPNDSTIALQLAPSAVTGRWQCWKRGQLARWPALVF